MRVFRPCPSYPGYSAALCGAIRRDPWVSRTKLDRALHRPALILRPTGPGRRYVYVRSVLTLRATLVADAWPDATRLETWRVPAGRDETG